MSAALEEISNVAESQNLKLYKHFEPVKETRVSAQFLQSMDLSMKDGKDAFLRSSMRQKKPNKIAFDESLPHPERATMDPDRDQNPCSYLIDDEQRRAWELQSAISHKVAEMKAMLIEMIVNDTLVHPCCEGSHDDVQIQGAVQSM